MNNISLSDKPHKISVLLGFYVAREGELAKGLTLIF